MSDEERSRLLRPLPGTRGRGASRGCDAGRRRARADARRHHRPCPRRADAGVDGPYAEAKEALGGYFLFECASIDEAVEWAARIPAAEHGAVEVRPVYFDPAEA